MLASERRGSLLADRHELGHGLPVPFDHDFLAILHEVQKVGSASELLILSCVGIPGGGKQLMVRRARKPSIAHPGRRSALANCKTALIFPIVWWRGDMERRGVKIVDTFAEAFGMYAARVIITAETPAWARTAAQSMTGFATSVIGCKIEAGIEADLAADGTPDGRPGVSVLRPIRTVPSKHMNFRFAPTVS